MKRFIVKITLVFLSGSTVISCASLGVKPWQRGTLAKESMLLEYPPLQAEFEAHTYFSKEASSGGRGFAGGGCGCN